jgi:hypothetical protein
MSSIMLPQSSTVFGKSEIHRYAGARQSIRRRRFRGLGRRYYRALNLSRAMRLTPAALYFDMSFNRVPEYVVGNSAYE